MKAMHSRFTAQAATIAAVLTLAASAFAAPSTVTAQLDRADIALGDSAQLTLTVSGNDRDVCRRPPCRGWSSWPWTNRASCNPSTVSPPRRPR